MANRLTFGNLIAHLIPGLLLFFLFLNSDIQKNYIEKRYFFYWFSQNEVLASMLTFSLALALGLCVDAFRYLLIKFASVFMCFQAKFAFKSAPTQDSEIARYNWIIDNRYSYHQFCGNLAIVTIAAIFLLWKKYPTWPFFVLSIILTTSAIAIYKHTIVCLSDSFPKE